MRHLRFHSFALCLALVAISSLAQAVPVTDNNTPGGLMANSTGASIKLWLRADALSQGDGTQVTSWTDSGPHGYNATGAAGNVPLFDTGTFGVLNNRPTLVFNDDPAVPSQSALFNSTLLTAGAGHFTLNENATSFTAYRNATYPQNNHFGIDTTGSAAGSVDTYTSTTSYNNDFRSSNLAGTSTGYPATGSHIKAVVSRDGDNTWQLFSDGRQRHSTTQAWGLNATYAIGQNTTHTSSSFIGEIAETVIYNTALNRAQQVVVENYLSSKYDIAIDAGGTQPGQDRYAGDTLGAGDYDLDVIGIGRVDVNNQHLNSGAGGFGIEAIALDNGEWLLAGHDGTPHGTTATTLGNQWDRVYFVDKTDVVNGVDATLAFDFSDAGLAAPDFDPATDVATLLYAPTSALAFSELGISATISGDTFSFAVPDSLLLDGYYTLAIVSIPEPNAGLLLGLGSLGLVWRARRVRRGAEQRSAI